MMFYMKYVLRRFEPSTFVNGHSSTTKEDMYVQADVQTLENISTTSEEGTKSRQRIKVFSCTKIQIADDEAGVRADWIYFQDKWFEAKSCRLSDKTLLRHYTSEFVQIPPSEIPDYLKRPDLEVGT